MKTIGGIKDIKLFDVSLYQFTPSSHKQKSLREEAL
jgi:hypothetical protein